MRKIGVIFFLFLVGVVLGQPPRNFYRTIGGPGDDIGYSCKVTLEGNYIVAGSTSSYGDFSTDFYLVKVDSIGNVKWFNHYGGAGNEVAKSVIQLPDSSYVMAGFTSSFGSGGYDAFIIRVDKVGNLKWSKTFGGTDWEFANDLVIGTDNNLYVVGNTASFGSGLKDAFVLKMDTAGNIITSKYFGGTLNDDLRSIIRTNDGNLATVGYTESRGEPNGDLYFLKIDYALDTLVVKTMGGAGKDYADDVTQHPNGEYYLSGAKTFTDVAKTKSYMHRLDVFCQFLSDEFFYRGTIDESFVSVASSKSTQIPYLTGFARTVYFPVNKLQAETFVAFPAGNYCIVNANGQTADEYVYSIEATNDRGFVSVGSTNGYSSLGKDIYFMKQDSNIVNYAQLLGLQEDADLERSEPFYYLQFDNLIIEDQNGNCSGAELYDLNGILVGETRTKENDQLKISTISLSTGIYVLKIFSGSSSSQSYKVLLNGY